MGAEKLTSVSQGARFVGERSSGSQADSQASFHWSSPFLVEKDLKREVELNWGFGVRIIVGFVIDFATR